MLGGGQEQEWSKTRSRGRSRSRGRRNNAFIRRNQEKWNTAIGHFGGVGAGALLHLLLLCQGQEKERTRNRSRGRSGKESLECVELSSGNSGSTKRQVEGGERREEGV